MKANREGVLIVVLVLISLISSVCKAQVVPTVDSTIISSKDTVIRSRTMDQRPLRQRISLGGSTGFWIQPSRTHLEVSALLGYRFPKVVTMGPGYRYVYTRNRIYGQNLNSYGPNAFVRAQLTRRLYIWTEWEFLHSEYAVQLGNNSIETRSDNVDALFLGAGYIRHMGRKGRGGISFQLLYNFLYEREDNSPYYSPVIYRIGYFF